MNNFEKITPENKRSSKLHFLIGCINFTELTGMPMYLLNLSKGLISMGHRVTITSTIGGEITYIARCEGIELFDWNELPDDNYDVLLLNEPISECLLNRFTDIPAYNIIHSARVEDEPISDRPQIRKYLCSKESDVEYVQGKVPEDKIDILPIPIDFDKFSGHKKVRSGKYKILAPCTIDPFRKPFLKSLMKIVTKSDGYEVTIKGKDFGGLDGEVIPKGVIIDKTTTTDMQEFMKNYDAVAGVLVGTVTLEAWAMDKDVMVYSKEGTRIKVDKPEDFDKHSHKEVAKKLISILNEKWADIIIPHHDQVELLKQTLDSIPPRNYNVIIVRGGTFSQNCNAGYRASSTDTLIFANDDLVLNPKLLWEMCDSKENMVGVPQYFPDGEPLCVGIMINQFNNFELTNNRDSFMYPSGALFKIDRNVFEECGLLDEGYKNGGEDQELFLCGLELGYTVGLTNEKVIHYCSQSSGRFDDIQHNDDLWHSRWTPERLHNIFGDNYNKESKVICEE